MGVRPRGDVQGWNGHALDDDVDIAGYRDGTSTT